MLSTGYGSNGALWAENIPGTILVFVAMPLQSMEIVKDFGVGKNITLESDLVLTLLHCKQFLVHGDVTSRAKYETVCMY